MTVMEGNSSNFRWYGMCNVYKQAKNTLLFLIYLALNDCAETTNPTAPKFDRQLSISLAIKKKEKKKRLARWWCQIKPLYLWAIIHQPYGLKIKYSSEIMFSSVSRNYEKSVAHSDFCFHSHSVSTILNFTYFVI